MSDENGSLTTDEDAAHRMLHKLGLFVSTELASDERDALAALLAPGIAAAYENSDDDHEVVGYQAPSWLPNSLPDHLSEAIKGRHIHIEGL